MNRSPESTELLLQLLQTLVSNPAGAIIFVGLEDVTPLTEIAHTHPASMEVLSFAWLNAMDSDDHKNALKSQIGSSVQSLASAFKTTDATTFLDFLGTFFRQAAPDVSTHITTLVRNNF